MKKSKLIAVLLVAILALCIPIAACAKAQYSIDKETAEITVGETLQLNVTSTSDKEFTVEWSSSDDAVATVSETGLVTAVKEGSAEITAKADGNELKCALTVKAKPEQQYTYKISHTSATLEEESTLQLSVTSEPEKALSVTWTSSDHAVATVSDTGLVTAVKEGTATVKAVVDGKELTCAVTVEPAPVLYTYTLNETKLNLENGKNFQLELTVEPEIENLTVVWETTDGGVASVDEEGLVTTAGVGNADINAKVDGKVVATCKVTVFEYVYNFEKTLTLDYGEEDAKLPVTVTPVKEIDISYVLENNNVIEIDEEGNITIVGVGTAVITVKDGETTVGTCTVTVNAVVEAEKNVQLHVGGTHVIEVTCAPANPDLQVVYEIIEGTDVIELGTDGKTITALKNGAAKVKVTAGEKVMYTDVLVNSVNATVENTDLATTDKINLSGADIAYWENYIKNEINHKALATPEEDIIEREYLVAGTLGYFADYAKLVWTDGDKNCAKPSKPDGWSEGTTVPIREIGDNGVKVQLKVKVFAGQSQIRLFTGVFKGTNTVTLYNGETAIAQYVIRNDEIMTRNMLTFGLDVEEATEIYIVLTLTNPTADNSFISLVGASVSGSDTYAVENNSVRVIPGGTSQINALKNGEPVTEGVTYTVEEGVTVVEVDENGLIRGLELGEAVIKVTIEGRVRFVTVNVGYSYNMLKVLQLHVNGEYTLAVTSDPEGSTSEAVYELVEGEEVISLDNGKVTALKEGTARVKATVDGNELYCDITVNAVNATVTVDKLEKDKNNPIDLTQGAEYWEQYIANGEINHKQYVNAEEDIITRTSEVNGNYLSDYPAFLAWHGGATGATCDCGQCAKDAHTTPDGGWNGDAGTKAFAVNQQDKVITLTIKVFAGDSVINVYTGGYNLVGQVSLKNGETVIAKATFDNTGAHNAQRVSFGVNVEEDTEITIEAVMINDNGNAPHSCISLAGVSVSGSVYQLAKKSARIIPEGETTVVLNKDGNPLTEGVTYEIAEGGDEIIELDANGKITGKKVGTAVVRVTADGRVRYFTVEVGYTYIVKAPNATLTVGATHQIEVASDPEGAQISATYASDNEEVATVDANGLVTAEKIGTAVITVTVDGSELTVTVKVVSIETQVREEETAGQVIDLTSEDIVYWEHYLYNEINPKAVDAEAGEKDLIEGNTDGKRGDESSTVKFWFAGSSGPKENAAVDGAFHKYSWGSSYSFDITVPAGEHEIRVYTGVWQSKNKTSLWNGEEELNSAVFERTNDGINKLVAFRLSTEEEKVLTLKIEALTGNNCRLNAIAIADVSAQTEINLKKTVNNVDGGTYDFTAENVLDWATFGGTNHEKEGGELILTDTLAQGAGAGQANDYKGNIKIGETETVRDFKFSDEYVSVQVKVTADVKKIALYVTGWNADYFVCVKDADGRVLNTEWVGKVGNQSVAKEVILEVDVTAETTLTLMTRKVSTSNCGIAGIALYGAQA